MRPQRLSYRNQRSLRGMAGRAVFSQFSRWVDQVAFAGRLLILTCKATPPRGSMFIRLVLDEIFKAGFSSLNLVCLIGFLIGYLWSVIWFGTLSNLGGIDSLSVLLLGVQTLEISPILTAVVLILRYGAPMTWEVAIMKSERQFNTLTGLGIPPEHYLGTPRIVGVFLAFPPLLAIFNISSVLGAYWGAWQFTGRPMWDFIYELSVNSNPDHFVKMFFKSSFASLSVAFFCFYNACRMPLGGLHSASNKIMRAAMGEALFYSILASVLVTVFYA